MYVVTGQTYGVAWDPKGRYLATISTDRICRIFDPTGKHVKARIHKGILPVPDNHTFSQKEVKYFHDDTFKSFFRRLAISPDGALLVAPSGYIEVDGGKEGLNATYIFAVNSWTRPAAILPSPRYATTVTRFCPLLFELHETGPDPLVALPYRMIFAVGTDHDVILYDTQQAAPFAHLQQIHYTRLTDLTWSPDGLLLIASSTDGYCSLITFVPGELGVRYVEPMLKSSTEINLNVSGCELLDHDDPILESAIIRKEDGDQEKDLVASPSFAKPKKPTLLEQWTMKSPKQQVEHQHATVTSATGGINNKDSTSEKCVRRIVPTRVVVPPCVVSKTNMFDSSIKPKQLVSVGDKVKTSEQTENITKSPLLNFLSKSNNTPPKQSRLSVQKSVATTAFVAPPDVIMDENEARDSWQCGKTDSKQSESMEMDDNECELSLQMEESTDDESQIVNKNVKVCEKVPPPSSANGKQNDEDKNHIVNENVNVTSAIIIENNTKIVNVPKRRIPLITLSSPKNKKK